MAENEKEKADLIGDPQQQVDGSDKSSNKNSNSNKSAQAPKRPSGGTDGFIADTRDEMNSQQKYRIRIQSTERDKNPVQVQINGYCYNIPRDKDVVVPASVIEVLRNAVVTEYELVKREDGNDGNDMVPRDIQRFAFSCEQA